MTEEVFSVRYINCAGCERAIRTLLGEVNAIEPVSADHRTNAVSVPYDAQRVNRKAVVDQLTDIGYAPKGP